MFREAIIDEMILYIGPEPWVQVKLCKEAKA